MTEIEITGGKVELRKPLAGERNKALIKAEAESSGSEPSKTVFITELLPLCIKSHPWGTTPIRQALDSLELKDYDALTKILGEMMNPPDIVKK